MDYKKKYKQLHKFISDLYPHMSEYCKEKVDGLIPELKENEDEKIRKALIEYYSFDKAGSYHALDNITPKQIVAWLEKQGEYANFRNKIQIGDKVIRYEDGVLVNLSQLNRVAKKYEKQCEQKVADKVESKFKIGDWIVYNDANVYQVKEIDYTNIIPRYELENIDGDKLSIPFTSDYNLRNWTIEDAKDGDVLVDDDSITIFRKIGNDIWNDVIDFYVCYNSRLDKIVIQKDALHCGTIKSKIIKPATKEQRDLLFQKMNEEGYEWDSENKVLKKI